MPIPRVTHRLPHTCLCQVWQLSLVIPITPIYRAFVDSPTPNAIFQWVTNPDSYHLTLGLSGKYDCVLFWATEISAYASDLLHPNIMFWITPQVSYTHTEFFGRYRGYLTPKFQAFHLRGLTTPFLLRLTHINYFSFYYLNYESLLDVVPKA